MSFYNYFLYALLKFLMVVYKEQMRRENVYDWKMWDRIYTVIIEKNTW